MATAFVRCFLPIPRVEAYVKKKLSCEASSFQFHKLKMWKRSFLCKASFDPPFQELNMSAHVLERSSSNAQSVSTHAKHNSTASSNKRKSHLEPSVPTAHAVLGRLHAKAITPETVEHASQHFSAAEAPVTRKNTMFRANHSIQITSMICENEALRARRPWNSKSWRCENEAFVRCFLEIPRVEDVKTKLFVRGFLEIPKVEDVKTKLSCDASFEFHDLKIWAIVFDAAVPLHKVSQHMQNTIAQHHQKILGRFHAKAITPETVEHASRLFSAAEAPVARKIQCFVQILTFKSHPWFVKTKLLCEASFKFQELKIWTSVFNAAVPIKTVSQDMQNTLEQGLRSGLCSLRHMPTGHNDLCTVLVAGAN